MTAETAKQKWKNLRDSYMRYKKFTKGETGQAKKYHKGPWSTHMNFFDYTLKPRSHSSNIPPEDLTKTEETRLSETENLLMSDDTQKTNASSEHSSATLRLPARQKEKKRKSYSHSSTENCPDDVDKVIDFLSNGRSKQGPDGIDHLFLSYAAIFKKFNPLIQATMKIKLVTLFAENEIKELEAHPTSAPKASTSHSRSFSAYSPHYPQYSDETEPHSRPSSAHSSLYTQHSVPTELYSRTSSVNPSHYTQHSHSETSRRSAKDVYEEASDIIQGDSEDNNNNFNLS
ncbi:uncharacterized protein [Leptinotarsa decemlineata]|uniref:uncharacterized protein n=1 Tax=Leptinotarsa decemlineata TaxID=7539 RepID=UPI003D306D00